jgi:hypothetical protein
MLDQIFHARAQNTGSSAFADDDASFPVNSEVNTDKSRASKDGGFRFNLGKITLYARTRT